MKIVYELSDIKALINCELAPSKKQVRSIRADIDSGVKEVELELGFSQDVEFTRFGGIVVQTEPIE